MPTDTGRLEVVAATSGKGMVRVGIPGGRPTGTASSRGKAVGGSVMSEYPGVVVTLTAAMSSMSSGAGTRVGAGRMGTGPEMTGATVEIMTGRGVKGTRRGAGAGPAPGRAGGGNGQTGRTGNGVKRHPIPPKRLFGKGTPTTALERMSWCRMRGSLSAAPPPHPPYLRTLMFRQCDAAPAGLSLPSEAF